MSTKMKSVSIDLASIDYDTRMAGTDMRLLDVSPHAALAKEGKMKTASRIGRYLLGFDSFWFGAQWFLNFLHMPGPTGIAAQSLAQSCFALLCSHLLLQIVPALLLLANRYVPLALTILGPIIFNIVCIHAFMAPAGLPWPCLLPSSGSWWRIRFDLHLRRSSAGS